MENIRPCVFSFTPTTNTTTYSSAAAAQIMTVFQSNMSNVLLQQERGGSRDIPFLRQRTFEPTSKEISID